MFDAIFATRGQDSTCVLSAMSNAIAMIEFEADGTIIKANHNFLNTMGYRLQKIVGQHHRLFVDEVDRESEDYKQFWAALRRGESQTGIFKRLARNGKTIWIQGTYCPVSNKAGQIVKIVKVAEDVTARKQADMNTQSVMDAVYHSQAVIEFELNGTIITANDNFLNTMGYQLEEVQGKRHSMFVSKEYRTSPEYLEFWDQLRAGKFQTGEFHRLGKDGKDVWIQATYTPITDVEGKPYKVVKFASDVTAQTLLTANFKGQLEAINRSQATIEFTMDGEILTANENFLTAMGYELAEIQGRHHRMFIEENYAESAEYKAFWDDLRAGVYKSAEFKRISKDGNEIWIQASYNPILAPDGTLVKVVKFATDRTEQVRRRIEVAEIGCKVDAALQEIAAAVVQVDARASEAGNASSQTTNMVDAIAAAAEEFGASAREIAQSVDGTRNAAARATSETEAADQSAGELTVATEAMNGIVGIIQDIAEQINLLALNATIEAARAGEAGRGFSVVASEVKSLANQVASAIGQITGEISNVQSVSGDVVTCLEAILKEVRSVNESVSGVAGAIEEQSAASQEMTANMQNASGAVNQINNNLQEISQAVASSAKMAESGRKLSAQLQN